MSVSFQRAASATATTRRNPAAVAGKVGAPVAYLTGLAILPPMPVSREIIERYQLKSPRKSYVSYTQGAPDVAEGDELAVGGVTYKVVGAQPWPTDHAYLELVLETIIGA